MCGEQPVWRCFQNSKPGSSPRVRGTAIKQIGVFVPGRFIPACAGNRRRVIRKSRFSPVHPRVCGEQSRHVSPLLSRSGSSPRVRGTVVFGTVLRHRSRFIPACAGNRFITHLPSSVRTVHPRVCGEQLVTAEQDLVFDGSSPRVRGTVDLLPCRSRDERFIPACAGNSIAQGGKPCTKSVHPRVCGEQSCHVGSSHTRVGSSPRVRGTAREDLEVLALDRFIPACAGNRNTH